MKVKAASLVRRAAGMNMGLMTAEERITIASIIALGEDSALPQDQHDRMEADRSAIQNRITDAVCAQAETLIALPAWTSGDIAVAQDLSSAEVGYCETLTVLNVFLDAYVAETQVTQVAPGWRVSLESRSDRSGALHGAVSTTGFWSGCQLPKGGLDQGPAAAESFAVQKEQHRIDGLEADSPLAVWFRSRPHRLEYNQARQLHDSVARRERNLNLASVIANGLSALASGDGSAITPRMRRNLEEIHALDPWSALACSCMAAALDERFGPEVAEPVATGLFEEDSPADESEDDDLECAEHEGDDEEGAFEEEE